MILEQKIFGLSLLPAAAILYASSVLVMVLYRVFLHPLSKFPGPKLAAATGWYRAYYDIWMGGDMAHQIERLHKQYGSVIRIGPDELSFNDPSVYHELYNNNSKLKKYEPLYKSFNDGEASFGYIDQTAARRRREVLNPMFSHRNITSMQGLIREKVEKLCERLAEYTDTGERVDISSAFRCATMDIIMSFCFAESFNTLDHKGFRHPVLVSVEYSIPSFWMLKHFPILQWALRNSPPWLSLLMSPETAGLLGARKSISDHLDRFLADPKKATPHPILYHRLLDPDIKRDGEPLPSRKSLFDEALVMLLAGSDTVGNTLSIGSFYVLENPGVYQKLFNELKEHWPNLDEPLRYEQLEKLSYLTAVVKESLRLSHGSVSSLLRVLPKSGAILGGQHIPGGAVVGSSNQFVHMNESIFQDPKNFIPERWLQPDSKHLDHWLVAFSRGPRMCLGVNLAWAELYIGFAHIFRKFDLEIRGTTREDLEWRDYFVPHYPNNHVKVNIKLRPD